METHMTTGPVQVDQLVRHTPRTLAVPLSMETVRAALPLVRALILALIVTLLIMVGLPQLLAAAAAAS
jgi:hypothetical protein